MTGSPDYFSELEQVFQASAEAHGETPVFDIRIAGQPVRIRFAGRSLVPLLTPALEHLKDNTQSNPALEIMAWDESSAASAMPKPQWSWQSYMSRGEIGGLDSTRYRAWFQLEAGMLSMIDLQQRRAMLWVRDAGNLPMYVVGAPFRMILNAWFSQSGLHFAHAAAVGTSQGGVLLAGAGGSGKSTTSLACLADGLDFVSDDYCLIGARPDPVAWSVYCSAKTDEAILPRLPVLAPSRQKRNDPPGEKALLLLNDRFAPQLAPRLRLLALLAPTVCDQEYSTLEPVKALEGIRALAPSTMEQIAGPDVSAWSTILSLAGGLRCYRLRLGRDIHSAPTLIASLIDELSGNEP